MKRINVHIRMEGEGEKRIEGRGEKRKRKGGNEKLYGENGM